MRRAVYGIMVTLLLVGMLILRFDIQQVKASGTIWIMADGSIDPPTAPIRRDGDLYVFTDNISEEIMVRRSNITVDGNGYTLKGDGTGYGFDLYRVNNVTIKNTNIKDFSHGVDLSLSSSVIVSGNTITNSSSSAVRLEGSTFNTFSGNSITNYLSFGLPVIDGFYLTGSSDNNTFSGNSITNSRYCVYLYFSSNNTISDNTINNGANGIYLTGSSFNTISGNYIRNASSGVFFWTGPNNNSTISGNTITNGTVGISVSWESFYNRLYHNNLIGNTNNAQTGGAPNTWDDGYPSGGNFWSTYTGVDANGDGIGDTPHRETYLGIYLMDVNNTDRYPLIAPTVWNYSIPTPVIWDGVIYPVSPNSNSTISMFKFNQPQKQISFDVSGSSGTIGYCNVTIPKTLLKDNPWTITINDIPKTDYTKTENDTHTSLYFTYTHTSTSHIVIKGTSVVPEFTSTVTLPLFMVITMLVFIVKSRFQRKPHFF